MKTYLSIIFSLFCTIGLIAQDSVYVYKSGVVISKYSVNNLDSLSFNFTPLIRGKVSDIDGNTYNTLKIGTQIWMTENLKTSKFRIGESISNITDNAVWNAATFAAWCVYNNDPATGTKYGKLYNWYAVNDSRKIAPVGWHVASDLEWTTLENFLIANGGNYDGTVIGNKISKALATNTDWNDGPVNAKEGAVCLDLSTNNSSGFSALPAGSFSGSQGEFFGLGFNANWWTSTEFDATTAYRRYIKNVTQDEEKGSIDKYEGLSVRCIKD